MHNLLYLLGIDFFIQFVGFLLAIFFRTEKFYDLAGQWLRFVLCCNITSLQTFKCRLFAAKTALH